MKSVVFLALLTAAWLFMSGRGFAGQISDIPPEPRWFTAAGEVLALQVIPWSWSQYVTKQEFSDIAINTVSKNIKSAFVYDRDEIRTNQLDHPYHGLLYFNAARTNGFNFWQSWLFTTAGSLSWELAMENEPVSKNDLINTTFGGAALGETIYRLSEAILDNKASGSERFFRELGAGLLNPLGGLNRIIFGNISKTTDNPKKASLEKFLARCEAGYQMSQEQKSQKKIFLYAYLEYNDPFSHNIKKPFDYFDTNLSAGYPDSTMISRLEVRGFLHAWHLTDTDNAAALIAAGLRYTYNNNGNRAFSSQSVEVSLLHKKEFAGKELRTEVGVSALPLGAIKTDYSRLNMARTGRNYDFGQGVGARGEIKLRDGKLDLLRLGGSAIQLYTANGISKKDYFLTFTAESRLPLTTTLSTGAVWNWERRESFYTALPAQTVTTRHLKLFLSCLF